MYLSIEFSPYKYVGQYCERFSKSLLVLVAISWPIFHVSTIFNWVYLSSIELQMVDDQMATYKSLFHFDYDCGSITFMLLKECFFLSSASKNIFFFLFKNTHCAPRSQTWVEPLQNTCSDLSTGFKIL